MRATDLQKKYPEMWEAVYLQVYEDCTAPIAAAQEERIAHNAAFVACHEHHKALKLQALIDRFRKSPPANARWFTPKELKLVDERIKVLRQQRRQQPRKSA